MGGLSFGLLGRRSAAISVGVFFIRCRTFEASGRHADLPRTAGRRVDKLVLHYGLTLSTRVRPALVGPTNSQHASLHGRHLRAIERAKTLVGILYHLVGQPAEPPQLLPYIVIAIVIVMVMVMVIVIYIYIYIYKQLCSLVMGT